MGNVAGVERDPDVGLGVEGTDAGEDRFEIVDQLENVGIDDRSFFDFPEERDLQPRTALDVEIYSGGAGGVRTSILGFDREIRFDRGIQFDEGKRFDRGAPFDQGLPSDRGIGFDSISGFDRERALQVKRRGLQEQQPFFLRREERRPAVLERGDRLPSREAGGGRVETARPEEGSGEVSLTRERENLEQELLRGQELELRSFKPSQKGFFIKIAMFVMALFFLLVGTLKGLIPLRFYFFLTILVLILWNPMESLFISIIVGLSALLAPLLG
jgi:hypothetical protein